MHIIPYLFLNGKCEQAAQFYQQTLAATIENIIRYSDVPEAFADNKPEDANKVLHMSLKIGDSILMASDYTDAKKFEMKGVELNLVLESVAQTTKVFNDLAEGGSVKQELIETFFSPCFGNVVDKFGVVWILHTDLHTDFPGQSA